MIIHACQSPDAAAKMEKQCLIDTNECPLRDSFNDVKYKNTLHHTTFLKVIIEYNW